MKIKVNNSDIRRLVRDRLGHFASDDMVDLTEDIVDRTLDSIDENETYDEVEERLYDIVYESMDSGLIYTKDQWTMLEFYCSPQNADFDTAWEDMQSDIVYIVEKILENFDTEDIDED